jgi:hypothetical protein
MLITGDEEKERCPLCHTFFDENDPALKFRFRQELDPIKPSRFEKVKKWFNM